MASTKVTLNASEYDTDKAVHTHYLRNYEEYFRPLLGRDIRLLELGVLKGGSLLLWRDYFERGVIAGLDLNPARIEDPTGRIRLYQGGQHDTELLDRIARECAPEGFDVIIDDCSHVGVRYRPRRGPARYSRLRHRLNRAAMRLYNGGLGRLPLVGRLASAAKRALQHGLYNSHNYGMVGFVKELVDELGASDITHPKFGNGEPRTSRFREMKL